MLFVCANAWGASQPKAVGTNLTESVSAIQPEGDADQAGFYRLPAITPENVPGHVIYPDGSTILLLRYTRPGATHMRLQLEDIHVPPGAALFLYTLDNAGQIVSLDGPVANGSEYWSAPLAGDTVYVEVDWQDEIPGDIPFRVTQLRDSNPQAEPVSVRTGERLTGIFRGREVTYEVIDDLAVVEGDIVIGKAGQLGQSKDSSGERDGVGITGSFFRWPNGVIPYYIPPSFPNPSRIVDAVRHWNETMGGVIRFVERRSERNYVTFYTSSGCSALVGYNGIGAHPVYLGESCTTGSVIHELGHTVGLWHEQSREDRNSYVKVNWSNIDLLSQFNFNQNIWNGDDIGAYDYNSIMHYGQYSFSNNGKPTLETIPAGIPIGQRKALSIGDINAVRFMYGAPPVSEPSKPASETPTTPTPVPPAPVPPPPPPPPSPATVNVSLQSNPSGRTIRVDGVNYTAPATVTWVVGSSHSVEAVTPLAGSTTYTFAGWSDGGAQSHSVTSTATLTVLKADFSVSHQVSTSAAPSFAGSVEVTPESASGMYPANTSVSLTANPLPGYCFTGWTGLLGGTPATTSISVTAPVSAVANFVPGSVTLGSLVEFVRSGGDTIEVPVRSSGYCAWVVNNATPWVTVVSGARGIGAGTVTLRVAPNTAGYSRAGIVLVGGRAFIISQSGN